ncbi:MAG: methyltransferase domain-containing protein [Nitrospiraceae bacterium]|jgi:SAM-dependent methyltransferase|nr:methyltransferase domain-containing protein [Nitrospiraceae bacterium]
MSDAVLHRHREVWQRKPLLRQLYRDWYRDIAAWLTPGRTVEIGGGTGNLKEYASGVCCTDVVSLPWLDAVADAQRLPFQTGSLANLVLFDALHHVENVSLFFDEALRTLKGDGRIIIMDPYISWVSWPVYRYLHPEPVDLTQDPLLHTTPLADRRPFDSNQAIATILFEKELTRFRARYPRLAVRQVRRLSFFAYPLSGGFDHPSMLPNCFVAPTLKLEKRLGWLAPFLAFRLFVVLEHKI